MDMERHGGDTYKRPWEPRDKGLRHVIETIWRHKRIRNASANMFSQVNNRPGLQFGILFNFLTVSRAGNQGALGSSVSSLKEGICRVHSGSRLLQRERPVLTGVRGPLTPGLALPSSHASHGGARGGHLTTRGLKLCENHGWLIHLPQTHMRAHTLTKSSPENLFLNGSYKSTLNQVFN